MSTALRSRGAVVFAAWFVVQLALVGWGLGTGRWPWRMFGDPASHRRHFVLEARTADGPWVTLALDDLFRYHRGATTLTVLDDAPAMYGRGNLRERRAFARWAVAELAPDQGFVEAHLYADEVSIRTGRARVDDLGTFAVGP